MKRTLCSAAAIIAISTAAFIPAQALAVVSYTVVVGNAPPPARYERVPNARNGYVWQPGYWNWSGYQHQWKKGHWERTRPGHHYQYSQWQQTNEGWRLNHGGWRTGDRDGDGIPNNKDKDRDGDGVRNNKDRQPDNPNRK